MDFNAMTDKAIAAELGRRIEQMRLEQDLTQAQLAAEIGLSRMSYRSLVAGGGKTVNLIGVLVVLAVLIFASVHCARHTGVSGFDRR